MQATVITERNADCFLGAIDTAALVNSDIFIGAVDEESDAAVGVLAAGAGGDHTLALRYIFVDEGSRRKGAGRAMISLLIDAAEDMDAEAVLCALVISEEELEIRDFLLSCGFSEMESKDSDMALLTYDLSAEVFEA